MKHSVNAKKAHTDLQQALDRMLKVLKNLNDSLHVVGLKGFPVSERKIDNDLAVLYIVGTLCTSVIQRIHPIQKSHH